MTGITRAQAAIASTLGKTMGGLPISRRPGTLYSTTFFQYDGAGAAPNQCSPLFAVQQGAADPNSGVILTPAMTNMKSAGQLPSDKGFIAHAFGLTALMFQHSGASTDPAQESQQLIRSLMETVGWGWAIGGTELQDVGPAALFPGPSVHTVAEGPTSPAAPNPPLYTDASANSFGLAALWRFSEPLELRPGVPLRVPGQFAAALLPAGANFANAVGAVRGVFYGVEVTARQG